MVIVHLHKKQFYGRLLLHSVPFLAARDWIWTLLRNKNHFIFLTPVTVKKGTKVLKTELAHTDIYVGLIKECLLNIFGVVLKD